MPFIRIYGPALLVTFGLMTLLWLASLPLRNSSIPWHNRAKAAGLRLKDLPQRKGSL